MDRVYDRSGNRITTQEWLARRDEQFVAKTRAEVDGREVLVSTVWLGLDHNHGGGPPLIFETMIFGLPGEEEPAWRYSTEEQAVKGHERAVQSLRDPIGRFTLGL